MKYVLILLIFSQVIYSQNTVQVFEIQGSVNGISDNGIYACGFDFNAGESFLWTEAGGKVLLGQNTEANGVSNDGIVAGKFLDPNTLSNGEPTWVAGFYSSGQWNKVGGIHGVEPFDPNFYTYAYSINASGTLMTGMAARPNYKVEACYWNLPDTTIHLLGQINGQNGRADDASNDGSIIVGWSADSSGQPDREPYYWDPAPHFMGGFDPSWPAGECNGISPDGNILVGTSSAGFSPGYAFRYTVLNGMQMITDSLLWARGYSADVSNNDVIVGHVEDFFSPFAFIWQSGWTNSVLLGTFLQDSLGVTGISDWMFLYARGISADGNVIGGEMINNNFPFGGGFVVKISSSTSVDDDINNPDGYILNQNYPNPFNPSTQINFTIPKSEFVSLTLYNSLGQEVSTLANEVYNAGLHTLQFDASGLASGIYLVKMNAGKFVKTIKMNLIK
ncbi:MAG: T9SS type A sorting domain-containing protein [bacterium]|nr:T9SS type A sorting domain-containing protein [bacterium]